MNGVDVLTATLVTVPLSTYIQINASLQPSILRPMANSGHYSDDFVLTSVCLKNSTFASYNNFFLCTVSVTILREPRPPNGHSSLVQLFVCCC